MPGREFDPHELPNELFCVWGMSPENPGPSIPHLGRFWVVPMQPFFLKSSFGSFFKNTIVQSEILFRLDRKANWWAGNFPS
jgi:hypothetical protein